MTKADQFTKLFSECCELQKVALTPEGASEEGVVRYCDAVDTLLQFLTDTVYKDSVDLDTKQEIAVFLEGHEQLLKSLQAELEGVGEQRQLLQKRSRAIHSYLDNTPVQTKRPRAKKG